MTDDIDFDGIRAEILCAATAITRAVEALRDDHSDAAVSARVDLHHIARDLRRGADLLNRTEKTLKGANA